MAYGIYTTDTKELVKDNDGEIIKFTHRKDADWFISIFMDGTPAIPVWLSKIQYKKDIFWSSVLENQNNVSWSSDFLRKDDEELNSIVSNTIVNVVPDNRLEYYRLSEEPFLTKKLIKIPVIFFEGYMFEPDKNMYIYHDKEVYDEGITYELYYEFGKYVKVIKRRRRLNWLFNEQKFRLEGIKSFIYAELGIPNKYQPIYKIEIQTIVNSLGREYKYVIAKFWKNVLYKDWVKYPKFDGIVNEKH